MALDILSPRVIRVIINEMYYRECIEYNTPENEEEVLRNIKTVEQRYAKQQDYELAAVVVEVYEEIKLEMETRAMNDKVDALISEICI